MNRLNCTNTCFSWWMFGEESRRNNRKANNRRIYFLLQFIICTRRKKVRIMRILPFLLLFLICNILCHGVDATIKVDNRTFSSSPDKYIGLHMKSGVEYSARLQRIPGDQHLCGGDQSNVTVPNDGLPSTWDNGERGEINE